MTPLRFRLALLVIPVAGPELEQWVTIFRNAVEDRDPLRYLQHAQRLYTWLIRPLEGDLARWPIQTIVWVPDGALRLLPLAALHDGQHFLVEKYALAVTPSLTLTEPRPLARDKLQVLAVGLSGAVEGFPRAARAWSATRRKSRKPRRPMCSGRRRKKRRRSRREARASQTPPHRLARQSMRAAFHRCA